MPLQIEITSEHKRLVGDDYIRQFGPNGGTIGRSLENDWILPDPDRFISGRHATIDFRGGAWYLGDTSTNGVYINGEDEPVGRGHPRRLFDGDRLRMGDFEFLVRIDEGEEIDIPPPAPASVFPDHPELRLKEETMRSGIQLIDEEELTGDAAFQKTVFGRTTRRMTPHKAAAARPAPRPAPRKPERRPAPPRQKRDPQTLTAEQVFEDFLNGLGIARTDLHPDVDLSEAMHNAGQVLREFVAGVVELLISRANVKSMFHLDQTTVLPRHNNPLKLSENTDELLKQLLVGKEGEYLGPPDSVREVSRDLKFHQDAVVEAMTSAFQEFAARFDPAELEEGFAAGRNPLLGAFGKMKYWQQYRELYPMLVQPAAGPFPHIFAEEFVRAYEKSVADAKRVDRDDSEAA
jgi:type VI secretion system protein